MIDPHTLELINLEIDGALDPPGREQLRRALESDPQAREMYDELRRVVHILETAVAVDPPRNLQGEILANVAGAKVASFEAAARRRRLLPLRLAASIAAGLLLVFLFKPSVFTVNAPDLRGTMRERTTTSVPAVSVTATVVPSTDPMRTPLRLDLHGSTARSIELHFDPRALQVESIDGKTAAVTGVSPGVTTLLGPQSPAVTVVFRRLSGSTSHVRVHVDQNGSKTYDLDVLLPPLPTN